MLSSPKLSPGLGLKPMADPGRETRPPQTGALVNPPVGFEPTALPDLTVLKRNIFRDQRGAVLHGLRDFEMEFPVGEVYVSQILPGVVKAWKRHAKMWQRFVVPHGNVQFVFYDNRKGDGADAKLVTIEASPQQPHYQLITVPPGIWYGFRAMGSTDALIVNCASMPMTPGESETLSLDQAPWYQWT